LIHEFVELFDNAISAKKKAAADIEAQRLKEEKEQEELDNRKKFAAGVMSGSNSKTSTPVKRSGAQEEESGLDDVLGIGVSTTGAKKASAQMEALKARRLAGTSSARPTPKGTS